MILMHIFEGFLLKLPCPSNINYMWNFGSSLGLFLVIQIVTGLVLSMRYENIETNAFSSILVMGTDTDNGWFTRSVHANGASLFFLMIYCHLARGLYFSSYTKVSHAWASGVSIFFLSIIIAFLGYVLPWGQMSFWAATVITNLISSIPYIGKSVVCWLWGGFAVGGITLTRFYSFHFLAPFVLLGLVGAHMILLHETGASNPTGIMSKPEKIMFHSLFTIKDGLFFMIVLSLFFWASGVCANSLIDPENFIKANSLVTPIHIMPEWYLLFAYAILRSIPNKLGGVIAMLFAILVYLLLVLMFNFYQAKGLVFKFIMWGIICNFLILSWIGAMSIEYPFVQIGQIFSLLYFICILSLPFLKN